MTRIIDNPIEVKVQVLDSNGDPVTSAAVNMKVYDESDAVFETGAMTHIGDGIYTSSFTPDAAGEWTVQTSSSNPKFRKTFIYHVETISAATPRYVWKTYADADFIEVSELIEDTFTQMFQLTGGVRIIALWIKQTNDESYAKFPSMQLIQDNWTIASGSIYCSSTAEIPLGMNTDALEPYITSRANTRFYPMGCYYASDYEMQYPETQVQGHVITINAKITGFGTNQKLFYKRVYQVYEAVSGA